MAFYVGAGTSLSSNYYLRRFYTTNSNARTTTGRSGMRSSELSLADSDALRRAVQSLGKMTFSEENETNIRNSVTAFVDVYNNTLSSASKSGDDSLERNAKQLRSLTSQYASELEKLGITVKGDGSLEIRSSMFESIGYSTLKELFSEESDYMQRTSSCAKRIARRSEDLDTAALHELFAGAGIGKNINISL